LATKRQREISKYPLLQLSTAIQVHKTGIILVFSTLFGLNGLMNIPAMALIPQMLIPDGFPLKNDPVAKHAG
jgi:hypothetical protein